MNNQWCEFCEMYVSIYDGTLTCGHTDHELYCDQDSYRELNFEHVDVDVYAPAYAPHEAYSPDDLEASNEY